MPIVFFFLSYYDSFLFIFIFPHFNFFFFFLEKFWLGNNCLIGKSSSFSFYFILFLISSFFLYIYLFICLLKIVHSFILNYFDIFLMSASNTDCVRSLEPLHWVHTIYVFFAKIRKIMFSHVKHTFLLKLTFTLVLISRSCSREVIISATC